MAKYAATKNGKSEDRTYDGPRWELQKSSATTFGDQASAPLVKAIQDAKGMSAEAKREAIAKIQAGDKAWTLTLDVNTPDSKDAPDRVHISGPCKTVKLSVRVLMALVENAPQVLEILKSWEDFEASFSSEGDDE